MLRIYLASSWKNPHHGMVLDTLRDQGFEVYDFRDPAPGVPGFLWSDIDKRWESWSSQDFIQGLSPPVATTQFGLDYMALDWANCGVLLLPCGKDAHMEAGWLVGAGKRLFILLDPEVPASELMYRMAYASGGTIVSNVLSLVHWLKNWERTLREER